MRIHRTLLAALALCLTFSTAAALGDNEKATELYEKGLTVLSEGDFDGAIKAFAGAAKADPENTTYRQHMALVNRVKQVRGMLEEQTEAAQWEKVAVSLRSFYHEYEIYGEALALDRRRFEKFPTVAVAVDLAETQLDCNLDADTAKLLGEVAPEEATPRVYVMLGISLARLGELEKARALAAQHGQAPGEDLSLVFDSACLNAMTGDLDLAATQLTGFFEQVPPSRMAKAKAYAMGRKDLASLRGEKYKSVWETKSSIAESGCSGGSDCGSCPSSGSCGEEAEEGGG